MEEATRFVNAKVGQFPHPQFCKRVFRTFPDAALPEALASEATVNATPVRLTSTTAAVVCIACSCRNNLYFSRHVLVVLSVE
jgi:hypothetical protein